MSITVNGVEITNDAVNFESAFHEEGTIKERHFEAARALVVRELLLQRARDLGIPGADAANGESDAAADEAIDALMEREVEIPEADEAACRQFYEANPGSFTTDPYVEVRHILLAAPPDDLEQREANRDTAEELIRELQAQPHLFDDFAQRYSQCPSKEQGGALGVIQRGTAVPEFEDAVFRLPQGLAERPVISRYGHHIVSIDVREEGELLAYEAVAERIADYLRERSRRRAIAQYIKLLASDADIEGIELDQADSPLLQ
jgi:peptidyl-prolyl cis-trans isomerase C